jgi:DNA-binding NtrC family response regulator
MKRLLIINDTPHLLQSLCIIFEGLYDMETARTLEAAIGMLQHKDAVILSGETLQGDHTAGILDALRKHRPEVPVVIICSHATAGTFTCARDAKAVTVVRKPFAIDELRLAVASALHTAALEQQVKSLQQVLAASLKTTTPDGLPLKQAVEAFERQLITQALAASSGVQTRAAEHLGTTRRILQYRVRKLGIACASPRSSD